MQGRGSKVESERKARQGRGTDKKTSLSKRGGGMDREGDGSRGEEGKGRD